MGTTYKPEDAKKRRSKDKALKDLDPGIREPAKKIIEDYKGDDIEKKRKELLRLKKAKDQVEK